MGNRFSPNSQGVARIPAHPAQDVADGVLWYGLPVDGALVMITSTRQACRADYAAVGEAGAKVGLDDYLPSRHDARRSPAPPLTWPSGL